MMDIKISPQKIEVAENEGSSATQGVGAELASKKTPFSSIFNREIRVVRESQRGNNSPEADYPKEENVTKIIISHLECGVETESFVLFKALEVRRERVYFADRCYR